MGARSSPDLIFYLVLEEEFRLTSTQIIFQVREMDEITSVERERKQRAFSRLSPGAIHNGNKHPVR